MKLIKGGKSNAKALGEALSDEQRTELYGMWQGTTVTVPATGLQLNVHMIHRFRAECMGRHFLRLAVPLVGWREVFEVPDEV